jgi:predicted Zn finger-like uncharacterized protein
MKFLCDNCKAKYQIADDKVAGKTVRMKCRKCGHLIEIRATAALAEATAFRSLPAEELSRIVEEPLTKQTSAPSKPGVAPRPAPRPAAGAAASATARKPAPAAPARPGVSSPVRPAARGSAAVALAPVHPEPQEQADAGPAPRSGAAAGGLASAFSRSVAADPPREEAAPPGAFDMGDSEANEEWYAGIGGVPVGPVRLSELRSKISAGQVTEETLVWREGFEEWVALRTVPALSEILRSIRPSDRISLVGRPSGKEKSNVVSLRQEAKTMNDEATAIFSSAASLGLLADKPAEAPPAAEPPKAAPSAPLAVGDPFASPDPFASDPFAAPSPAAAPATPAAPAAPVALAAPVAADFPAPAPAPNRIPPAAWVVVALALAVGVLGGTMLVPKEKTQTEVQVVTIEKVVSSPAPQVTNDTTSETQPSTPDASASAKKVALVPGPLPKTTATGTAATSMAAVAAPLPTFNTLAPSPTSDAPPTSTETIPAGKLQEVVNSHRTSIRRTCWDPVVASGAATGSVKVTVTLTIVAGRVTTVSVGGADGRLGGCIQGRVRGWQFPTGFAPTSTSFTLTFVAQG